MIRGISVSLIVAILVSFIAGCEKANELTRNEKTSEIEVPALQTVEEYFYWGKRNGVKIKLVNSSLEQIEGKDYERMIEITPNRLFKGETLEIVVCEKGMTCVQITDDE